MGGGKSSTVGSSHGLGNGVRFASRCAVVQFENSPCSVGGKNTSIYIFLHASGHRMHDTYLSCFSNFLASRS